MVGMGVEHLLEMGGAIIMITQFHDSCHSQKWFGGQRSPQPPRIETVLSGSLGSAQRKSTDSCKLYEVNKKLTYDFLSSFIHTYPSVFSASCMERPGFSIAGQVSLGVARL